MRIAVSTAAKPSLSPCPGARAPVASWLSRPISAANSAWSAPRSALQSPLFGRRRRPGPDHRHRVQLTVRSNGLLEGTNSLIQAAKRRARGYRPKPKMITIIYLIAGKRPLPKIHTI